METFFKKKIFNVFLPLINLRLGHQQTESGEEIVAIRGEETRSEILISGSGEDAFLGGACQLSCDFLQQWLR